MRSPKIEPLKKNELMKVIVKKCNNLTSGNKAVKCSRCGYVNGLASTSDAFIMNKLKEMLLVATMISIFNFPLTLTLSFLIRIKKSNFVIWMLAFPLFIKDINPVELGIDAMVCVLLPMTVLKLFYDVI